MGKFNELMELEIEEISAWDSAELEFQLDKKVYHFYPGSLSTFQVFQEGSEESLKLYPNPVQDMLQVSCKGIPKRIDIINLHGQVVLSAPESPVDLSSIPGGVYLVRVYQKDGGRHSAKMLKK